MSELSSREQIQIGRALRLDRRSALDLLRDLARDRAVLADLRRLWAREAAATTLCFAADDQVLAQLAERIATGALVIARVRPPPPNAPPPGAGDVEGEATLLADDAAEQAQDAAEKPALMSPRWSVARVEVGADLDAVVTYAGCDPGQSVTFKIYEINAGGSKKLVDTVEAQVSAKGGDHNSSGSATRTRPPPT